MIMADVFAVFGTLLAIGIALPGLMLAWQLLLPNIIKRSHQRLEQTPWQSVFVGGGFLFFSLIPITILFNLPWGGFRAMGFIGLLALITIASIGAAGLSSLMGDRLQSLGFETSVVGATVRGAIAMELAAAFPIIGWFIFVPIIFVITLGAAVFALVGWGPRRAKTPALSLNQDQSLVSAPNL